MHLHVCKKINLATASQHEPQHEISNNVVCATSKGSDQLAQMHSLIIAFASRLNIPWLFSYWYNMEFLSL